MNDFLSAARALAPGLKTIRETLHRHPEPGNAEFETAAFLEKTLNGWGIATKRLLGTAVTCEIAGGLPGRTVALRADMDALPLAEETGCAFASENPGMMHACGHDVHMTAALGCARLLLDRRDGLRGTVRFLFEPDEEGSGGAARLVAAGALEGVSAVFGAHVDPALPAGEAGVRFGKFYAASDTFDVTLFGKSAHGATPEKGIDALAAAVRMVSALEELPKTVPQDRCVLTVGTFRAGTARNIVADRAEFSGILRTLGPDDRERMCAALKETVAQVAKARGVRAELTLKRSYGGIVNTDAETALARRAIAETLGSENTVVIEQPTMTTEDFGVFTDACSGSFYHLGAGCPLPLHNPAFLPVDEAYITGAAVHAAVLTAYLNG